MNRIFADTFYWVALITRKDASNEVVLQVSRTVASAIVTTGEVLTEVLAFCSSNEGLRKDAAKAVRRIFSAGNVRVIPQSREGFLDGLALYEIGPTKVTA